MKTALLISTALFALSCSPREIPQAVMSPTEAAFNQLPQNDRVRTYLTGIVTKSQHAQRICADQVGKSGGERAKLYDILGRCTDYQAELLRDVRNFRGGSVASPEHEKIYAIVISDLRMWVRFYSGAQMCVKTSRTQADFNSCIESLTQSLRNGR